MRNDIIKVVDDRKKRRSAFVFIIVIVASFASFASAANDNAGASGAAFMKLFGSARAMAMGRAYVALAEGSDALTWNPAGLALTQTREVTYSYLRYLQGIDSPLYLAYAHPRGRNVFGTNVAYMTISGFDLRDDSGRPQNGESLLVQNGFVTGSVARSFMYEKLFLGTSLKMIQENNGGPQRRSTVLDFGALLKPTQTLSFGMAFQNLGGSRERVAKITRLGGAWRPMELLNVSFEAAKPSDNNWKLGLGGEFTLPEEMLSVGQVALRVGYYAGNRGQGSILPDDRNAIYPLVGAQGMTFGLGLFSSQVFGYGIAVDYALVPIGALGSADYLSLKMKF